MRCAEARCDDIARAASTSATRCMRGILAWPCLTLAAGCRCGVPLRVVGLLVRLVLLLRTAVCVAGLVAVEETEAAVGAGEVLHGSGRCCCRLRGSVTFVRKCVCECL